MARVTHSDEEEPDDENDEEPTPSSRKRKSKASEKIQHADKENLDKAEIALRKAQKKVENLRKARGKKTRNPDPASSEPDGPESEDEDEGGIVFSSSIRALDPIVVPQKKTPEIRRITLKELPVSKTSRRDFVYLPSATSSSQGHFPAGTPTKPSAAEQEHQASCDDEAHDDYQQFTPSSTNKRPHSLSSDTPQQPRPKKAKTLERVVLRAGLDLKKPPTLSDFTDVNVQALLLRAMHEYEAVVCTKGAFPGLSLRVQWAGTCWVNAQNDASGDDDGSTPRYEFTDRMLRLMQRRGSRVRGDLLDPVREQIMSGYGFREGGKARDVQKNARTVSSLLIGRSFHYKDPKAQTGYCENPVISNILAATWFKDLTSAGIIFKKYFDPISIDTLALVLTLINHCLKEWKTGKRVRTAFSEKDKRDTYIAIRVDLDDWQNLNMAVTTNRRKKLFKRACTSAGVVDVEAVQPQLVREAKERARQELEGHTGETDSEAGDVGDMEVDDDDDDP
ncbi:hypothetical protein B0H34DRAFT_432557 [Crassisporium funariophilum]|nr:hypothetical protein B0H34DRAFT_432557 [Crassisporium funariophilum]